MSLYLRGGVRLSRRFVSKLIWWLSVERSGKLCAPGRVAFADESFAWSQILDKIRYFVFICCGFFCRLCSFLPSFTSFIMSKKSKKKKTTTMSGSSSTNGNTPSSSSSSTSTPPSALPTSSLLSPDTTDSPNNPSGKTSFVSSSATYSSGGPMPPVSSIPPPFNPSSMTSSSSSSSSSHTLSPRMGTSKLPKTVIQEREKGITYYKRGDLVNAHTAFSKAIVLTPSDHASLPSLFTRRALCNLRMNQNEAAIDDARRALEINPKFVKAYVCRGVGYFRLMKYQNANDDYTTASKLQQGNQRFQETLATAKKEAIASRDFLYAFLSSILFLVLLLLLLRLFSAHPSSFYSDTNLFDALLLSIDDNDCYSFEVCPCFSSYSCSCSSLLLNSFWLTLEFRRRSQLAIEKHQQRVQNTQKRKT
jgi:tetratricopeptide (TPR) repeat protein